jgi:hypothetical protein
MKFNKWTLGLAALGVVSLASVASAEEKQNFLQTALSSTTISGYVDTSIEYQIKPCNQDSYSTIDELIPSHSRYGKRDGFNLNVVKLSIEKPLDESEWAAGYKVDLLFGPDAVDYNISANAIDEASDFGIKQAYVALRAPLGNGLEFKIGTFDTVVGYEVFEAGNNPNFTRSWAYAIEPTSHTGILASYRVIDEISISAGVANTLSSGINNRNFSNHDENYWCKAWMGSIALTAPESWGWAKGSSLYGGVVYGWAGNSDNVDTWNPITGNYEDVGNQANYYVGLTLNTPVTGLKAGITFDRVCNLGGRQEFYDYSMDEYLYNTKVNADVLGVYLSYQATEKLSLHARGEWAWVTASGYYYDGEGYVEGKGDFEVTSLTGTVQYDLWQNVVSRLEIRWDQVCKDLKEDSLGLYANIIYKF